MEITAYETVISSFSTDADYILHVKSNKSESKIAVASSSKGIVTHDIERLQQAVNSYSKTHSKKITDLQLSEKDVIFSSSEDGTINAYDSRNSSSNSKIMSIQLPTKEEQAQGISLGYNDTLLSVASSNATIRFYDIRNSCKLLGTYQDAHSDVVTQVRFQSPTSPLLLSASEDGLICIHDTSQATEELALSSVLNVQNTIRQAGFFAEAGVYCLTGTETMSAWHHPSAQIIANYQNIRESIQADYLVGAQFIQDQLLLLSGTYEGLSSLIQVTPENFNTMYKLKNHAHRATLRDFCILTQRHVLITGAEDSRLCAFRLSQDSITQASHYPTSHSKSGPIRNKMKKKKSHHSPY